MCHYHYYYQNRNCKLTVVRRAKTVTAHTIMGSELIGTGTLTFTGVSKIGGCIKDVFQSIGIVFGAGSLAR